ncbi:MAG: LLM class F420-dependent oxidoreductase [Microthrixaceae bacterium]
MDLRIFIEPQQGASYEQQLAVAQRSELLGFDAFFRSDHLLKMGDVSGLPGPSDSWVTLGAIARETSSIRLGTMVTSITFRQPGLLALTVAQVDQMSSGRVECGIGAGWFDLEHLAYGIEFPPLKERFDRLEETLEILQGLWHTPLGETFSHHGEHWTIEDSPALPKPAQVSGPPIIVGGAGPRRTPQLAARFAAEFNTPFFGLEDAVAANARVDEACQQLGRNPATLRRSNCQVLCCGATEAEFAKRAAAIGREPDELRANGLAGTPEELIAKLRAFSEIGMTRMYLQTLDLDDLDHLDLIAETVLAVATELP